MVDMTNYHSFPSVNYSVLILSMRNQEDRSGTLVTCTGNPCQSTGTSSPVSTGDLPVLPVQVTNSLDQSSGFLIAMKGETYL